MNNSFVSKNVAVEVAVVFAKAPIEGGGGGGLAPQCFGDLSQLQVIYLLHSSELLQLSYKVL